MTNTIFVSRLLTAGGDARIKVAEGHNTNQYGSSPFPRSTLGYASSTANDISLPAFEHLGRLVERWSDGATGDPGFYAAALESLRHRVRAAWELRADTAIVFAPSGTDLEYVALALSGPATTNLIVGADEVGSGCTLSAEGRYFAQETAVVPHVRKGEPVEGFADPALIDIPVRDRSGHPTGSPLIASRIGDLAASEAARGRTCLAHVVYGSKTGLILPELGDIDRLRRRHPQLRFVVDACQARISGSEIRALLDRNCIVLLTGSKFMGGPPFSGMALVPPGCRPRGPLPTGLATIFRRAEWPTDWAQCESFPADPNPGLLLRLEAALFELERFLAIPPASVDRVIGCFADQVRCLAERIGARLVQPCLRPDALCTSTLATLDLTVLPSQPDFDTAQRWHRVLAARGLRLGQAVRCTRLPDGRWGGTLRLSLSMPMIAAFADLDHDRMMRKMGSDMIRIGDVIVAAGRAVA